MKVFVLVIAWSIDYEVSHDVLFFRDIESARKELEKQYEKEQELHPYYFADKADRWASVYRDTDYTCDYKEWEILEKEI